MRVHRVDPEGRRDEEELGRVEVEETIIRIHRMRKEMKKIESHSDLNMIHWMPWWVAGVNLDIWYHRSAGHACYLCSRTKAKSEIAVGTTQSTTLTLPTDSEQRDFFQ